MSQGLIFPAAQKIISKWSPHEETGKFVFTLIGGTLGPIVAWPASGFVMQHLGWAWAFHLPAFFTLVLTAVWYYCVYDSPFEHPGISTAELHFIEMDAALTRVCTKSNSTKGSTQTRLNFFPETCKVART